MLLPLLLNNLLSYPPPLPVAGGGGVGSKAKGGRKKKKIPKWLLQGDGPGEHFPVVHPLPKATAVVSSLKAADSVSVAAVSADKALVALNRFKAAFEAEQEEEAAMLLLMLT